MDTTDNTAPDPGWEQRREEALSRTDSVAAALLFPRES